MEMCSNRHNSDSEVNTSRSTSWAVKCFQNYLKNKLLCKFHGSIVSNQGHYYSISSSVGLRDDVRRFITTPLLVRHGVSCKIIELTTSNNVFSFSGEQAMTKLKITPRSQDLIMLGNFEAMNPNTPPHRCHAIPGHVILLNYIF